MNMPERNVPTTHRLRVTLLDVAPPVWRELRVPSTVPLSVLHLILQAAFGWGDAHLHEWEINDVTYAMADEESWGEELEDESQATLAEVAPLDSSFLYRYDLGDGWEHLVEVLGIDLYDATVEPVALLGGERAAPPDDSGGPTGYEHLLDALADPDDPQHEEMRAWVGDGFDPAHFDREEVEQLLEALWRVA
jgi:hypothetical protein